MKKNLVLLLALLFVGSSVFAQRTAPTNGKIDASDRIGSAASSPVSERFCPDTDFTTDQLDAAATSGYYSNEFDPMWATPLYMADNFTASAAVNVQDITVYGFLQFFLGAYEAADAYDVIIYDDAAGAPGSVVCSQTFNAATVDPDGDGVFSVFPSCSLPAAGNYWLSVVFLPENANSAYWVWYNGLGDGNTSAYDATGGFGLPAATWTDFDAAGGATDFSWTLNLCESDGSIVLVPTMGEWSLFLFGLGMVTLGLVFVYNKQRQLA